MTNTLNNAIYDDNDELAFDDEDELLFDENESEENITDAWKIMIVDDDTQVHSVTKYALKGFRFAGKPLTFISAYSGEQAKRLIEEHPDTATILLDVVMETNDAGLKVVKHIREVLNNQLVRIILRTGQPGEAPEETVIVEYDINDYKTKTELTHQKLFITMTAVLRSYNDVITIEANRQELAERSAENARLLKKEQHQRQLVEQRTQELSKTLENLKATQQELIRSEKMAAIGQLVAGISHEVNTPIGICVTAASELEIQTNKLTQLYENARMKRSNLEEYLNLANQGCELVLRNLGRAAELMRSFKQVAVDQVGEQPRTFMLKEYLHEILTTLRPQLKRTQHQVTIECDNIVLSSYPGIFSQIITNFIMNSLIHGFKEQPNGQITIEATTNTSLNPLKRGDLLGDSPPESGRGDVGGSDSPLERGRGDVGADLEKKARDEGARLILRYSDNGKGISADTLNKIYDPFFTTNRNGGGSGLGLHIVYNLVTQKLNGTIHCESVETQGTTFTLSIPIEN